MILQMSLDSLSVASRNLKRRNAYLAVNAMAVVVLGLLCCCLISIQFGRAMVVCQLKIEWLAGLVLKYVGRTTQIGACAKR